VPVSSNTTSPDLMRSISNLVRGSSRIIGAYQQGSIPQVIQEFTALPPEQKAGALNGLINGALLLNPVTGPPTALYLLASLGLNTWEKRGALPSALATSIEEGGSLAQPVARLLRIAGQEDLAGTVERHPFVSELVVGGFGGTLASRVARRAARATTALPSALESAPPRTPGEIPAGYAASVDRPLGYKPLPLNYQPRATPPTTPLTEAEIPSFMRAPERQALPSALTPVVAPPAPSAPAGNQPGFTLSPIQTGLARAGIGAAIGAPIGAGAAPEGQRGKGAIVGALAGAALLGPGATVAMRKVARESEAAIRATLAHPTVRVVDATVDHTGDLARRMARAANPTDWERLYQGAANFLQPLERLGTEMVNLVRPSVNPAYTAQRYKAADETIRRLIYEGIPDPLDATLTIGPSLQNVFEPLGRSPAMAQAWETFVKGVRDFGRGGAGGSETYTKALPEALQRLGTHPELVETTRRYEAFNNGLRQYAEKSGLYTPVQTQKLFASDLLWVPYHRLVEDIRAFGIPGNISGRGGRFVNVSSGIKRFKGSQRAIESPIQAIFENADRVVRAADRYRVGEGMFRLHEAAPDMELLTVLPEEAARLMEVPVGPVNATIGGRPVDAEMMEILRGLDPLGDPNNPSIWRHVARPVTPGAGIPGPMETRKQYARVNYPRVWLALQNMRAKSPEGIAKVLYYTFGTLKRVMTATTTGLSMKFSAAYNPMRDIPTAAAQSQHGATGIADDLVGWLSGFGKAANEALGRGTPTSHALESGLGGASMYEQPISARGAQRILAPVTRGQRLGGTVSQAATRPLVALEKIGTVSDRGPRYTVAERAMRAMSHKVESGEWTQEDLLLYGIYHGRANSTIDFWNMGSWKTMQVLKQYIPFFGPSTQAPLRTIDAFRTSKKKMVEASVLAALTGVWEWVNHRQSPEVQEMMDDRDPNERASFGLFAAGRNGSLVFRVPMPQEMNLFRVAAFAGLEAAYEQNPSNGQVVRDALARAAPAGLAEILGGYPPIPGAQQLVENKMNRRAYGGAPVVPQNLQRQLPVAQRRETTAPTFDLLAAAIRKVPGYDQVSPLQVENVVRGVITSMTPLVTALTDVPARALMGGEAPVNVAQPFSRSALNPYSGLLGRQPPTQTAAERRYYDLKRRIEQAAVTFAKTEDEATRTRLEGVAGLVYMLRANDRNLAFYKDQREATLALLQRGRITPEAARNSLDSATTRRQRDIRGYDRELRAEYARARTGTPRNIR
jgi:hypothetical protein